MNTIALLMKLIYQFVSLQNSLMFVFHENYRDSQDHKFLLDFPRSGVLELDGVEWSFHKHGAGLLFENQKSGAIVDIHKHIQQPKIFDLWRLERFLESVGHKDVCDKLELYLEEVIRQGKIVESVEHDGYFRLSS